MLRLGRLGSLCLMCAAGLWSESVRGENYAFLVAVQEYDVKDLKPLRFTRGDILEFAKLLGQCDFQSDNIVVMTDKPEERRYLAEAEKIRTEFDLLLAGLREKDTLIVAFSGHGVQFEGDDKNYYCPADANLDDPQHSKLIAISEIYDKLKNCPAQRKLLLVDACRNDPMTAIKKSRSTIHLKSVTRPQAEPTPKGMVALFSCAAGQESYEWPEFNHGVFFNYVLEGWKGKADTGDKDVTLNELVNYATEKTQSFARRNIQAAQTPQFKSDFEGSWVLKKLLVSPEAEEAISKASELVKSYRYDDAQREIARALELEPNYARAWAMRGWLYNKVRKFDLAIADNQHALELKPDYSFGYFNLGVAYAHRNENDLALENFSKAIGKSPKYSDAYANRALAWDRKGKKELALADCAKAIEYNPKSALAFETRGILHRNHHEPEEALLDFTKAIELSPTWSRPYMQRSMIYGLKRDQELAIRDLKKAIELEPANAEYHYRLGKRYEAMGSAGRDKALACFTDALSRDAEYVPALYSRGQLRFLKKEYDLALTDLNAAQQKAPKDPFVRNTRGLIYRHRKELDKALEDFSQAIQDSPRFTAAWQNRAHLWMDKGQFDKAISDFTHVVQSDKTSDAYYQRGLAYRRKGQNELALSDFLRAVLIDPKNYFAHFECGVGHMLRNDPAKAIESYTRVLEGQPRNVSAYSNRGAAHLARNEYEQAIADFTNAIGINPSYRPAYEKRALAYEKRGLTSLAQEDRKKLRSLSGTSKSGSKK